MAEYESDEIEGELINREPIDFDDFVLRAAPNSFHADRIRLRRSINDLKKALRIEVTKIVNLFRTK